MSPRTSPPFRADHVGSLLRPARLHAARADRAAGKITPRELRAVEDDAIREAVALQREAGLRSVTDGEFRRATWHMDFIYQIGGISQVPGSLTSTFHNEKGDINYATPGALRVTRPLSMDTTIFGDDFAFLQSVANGQRSRRRTPLVPKLTIPAPSMVHYRSGIRAVVNEDVYPDVEEFWTDLAAAYNDEMRRLAGQGCRYLQLDDTSLAYVNDPAQRAYIAERGEDAENIHLRYISLTNAAVAGRPAVRTAWRSPRTCAGATSSPPGWPQAATTSSPRRCSTSLTWTGSSSNTTTSAPAASSRCGSSRRASRSSSAW
jgi:5-methyltetrahydropteroyltriglutamate--homocysteine methyltransferase